MVNCPECGKPLLKGRTSKYYCENDNCSIISVVHPNKPPLTRITRKAQVCSGFYERLETQSS